MSRLRLPQDFFPLLHNKHLLLDTSFFGDYSSYPEIFVDFVDECKRNNITLVTNVPVTTEFFRGSDTPLILAEKKDLVNRIVDYLLPITPVILNVELPWLTEKYGQIGKSISITDFILAAQTKAHARDCYLLTKNPKDFPTSIFSVKTYFLLQLERGLQVYGVYGFGQDVVPASATDQEVPF